MAPFSWLRGAAFRFQPEHGGDEVDVHSQGESDDAASMAAVQGSSRASSTDSGSGFSWWCPSSSSISEVTLEVKPSCVLCGVDTAEPLFISPCKCTDKYTHRSCLEKRINQRSEGTSCLSCGAAYAVRRETKPIWRWVSEQDSRGAALRFTANLTFCCGNIFVLALAWLYILREFRSSPWLPALLGGLFVLTVFWLAFSYVLFHILYKPLARWKNKNTKLVALLDGEGIQ